MLQECPLPQLDFDMITMGHGSGGQLTHKLLEAGVFSLFDNPFLSEQHDGAVLPSEGDLVFTTDSFVVSPLFFPGGNIGELAVYGTVNDLAMSGGIPKYLSLAFILEEGLKMSTFWDVLVSIKYAADLAGVQVVTGDTKVVEKGKGDQLFINTTGIGFRHPKSEISINRVKTGDKIIVSGQLANHGVAVMSVREGIAFDSEIVSDTRPLHQMSLSLLGEFGSDIHLFRDPTRGGLATALTEIAMKTNRGMDIFQNTVPISTEVESACELLGLDPFYVANEGIFIAIVDANVADCVLNKLSMMKSGSYAAIIGEVTYEHSGKVVLHNDIGGKRVLGLLPGEQLPRIC